VREHPDAKQALIGFAARKLRREGETDTGQIDARFLAGVLLGDPESTLIEALVTDLTRSSMQSAEELKRVAAHLGVISDTQLVRKIENLKQAFAVRNRLAHDMDVNFAEGRGRNRRLRKRADMVREANSLLGAAEALVRAVDKEL
jgi:transposase-like protein